MSIVPFSSRFNASLINVGSAEQYVRTGGSGPAVLLLHGFGDTGDMWQPLAEVLAADHMVIVPDLRGMGLSTHPEGGYEKTSQARDLASILDRLAVDQVMLVTHDIGNMVGYAVAAQFPQRVTKWIVMDAPLPGLGTWEKQLVNPLVWHFNFRGPDVERLVAGRERILLDRFYNELSAKPAAIDENTRRHYAELYARAGRYSQRLRRPVCRLCARRRREQSAVCEGREASHAGPRDRRRPFVWSVDEVGTGIRRERCPGSRHHRLRPLDHGRTAATGHRHHHQVHRRQVRCTDGLERHSSSRAHRLAAGFDHCDSGAGAGPEEPSDAAHVDAVQTDVAGAT